MAMLRFGTLVDARSDANRCGARVHHHALIFSFLVFEHWPIQSTLHQLGTKANEGGALRRRLIRRETAETAKARATG
jgi:hypothetical protein